MPMTIKSDVDDVVQLAQAALDKTPTLTREDAAALALRDFYSLAPRDGIWAGSEAAACMGYGGFGGDEDFFFRIVVDVAAQLL